MTDSGGAANPNELGTQAAFNYHYNEIGQLTDDDTAKIHSITWNVYGKILSVVDSTNTITFTYDASGNRISKTAHGITTWYVRDAQGNVMSVYTQGNSAVHGDSLTQTEADIYGSSRLGLLNLSVNCAGSLSRLTQLSLVRGSKLFELTNHLGNVLETISDKKIQHTSDSSTVDYYLADVAVRMIIIRLGWGCRRDPLQRVRQTITDMGSMGRSRTRKSKDRGISMTMACGCMIRGWEGF